MMQTPSYCNKTLQGKESKMMLLAVNMFLQHKTPAFEKSADMRTLLGRTSTKTLS